MKKITQSFILLFSFILFSPFLYSQDKIITDRPDQTESSVSIPKGALQFETGILGERLKDNFKVTNISHPTLLLRYGLFKAFELRLVQEYNSTKIKTGSEQKITESSGLSDLQLGAKIEILNKENVLTQIGFLSHVILPTGTKGISEESYSSTSRFLISHALDFMDIGYNIGFDYKDSENYQYAYTLALAFALGEKLGVFIEPYGELDHNSDFTNNINAGFTYLLNDEMQLDLSAGKGLNHQMHFLSLGFSALMFP